MEFVIKTKIDFSEYQKFNKVILNVIHKDNIKFIFGILIFIGLLIFSILTHDYYFSFFITSFFIVLLIITKILVKNSVKKSWNTNKLLKDIVFTYTFSENQFTVSANNGSQIINKNDIYRFIETKTNFYIMLSNNTGYIILKENCTEEQKEFIVKNYSNT